MSLNKDGDAVTPSPRARRNKVPINYAIKEEEEDLKVAALGKRKLGKLPMAESPHKKKSRAQVDKIKPAPWEASQARHSCVIGCGETMEDESSELRYHYTSHYYKEALPNSIEQHPMLKLLDKEDKGKLVAAFKDLTSEKKYGCLYQENCTKRQMSFYEFITHNFIAHHKVKDLMDADPRTGMATIRSRLYPEETPTLSATLPTKGKYNVKRPVESSFSLEEYVDDPDAPLSEDEEAHDDVDEQQEEEQEEGKVLTDKVHDCLLCTEREGRNLSLGSGISDLKYHYTVCYYNKGAFIDIVKPGSENQKEGGEVMMDDSSKFVYKCPYPKCTKNTGKLRVMGYREYATHMGSWHNMVELVMAKDRERDMKDILATLRSERRKKGDLTKPAMPREAPIVEELHCCQLCFGKKDKEAASMSLSKDKLSRARYHYASCYYTLGVYWAMYSPGEDNTGPDGKPIDEVGNKVKYACNEPGCDATRKRKMGYMEFAIHSSNNHGGLITLLKKETRPELRKLANRFNPNIQN